MLAQSRTAVCVRDPYQVLYPQHPAQSLAHSRTLVFLNEGDFGPQLPPAQEAWRNGMGYLRRQGWCQMLLEHLLCARLGWGQSQIHGVRYGIPTGLGTTQKISLVQRWDAVELLGRD